MTTKNKFTALLILSISFTVSSQSILGKWTTVDNETGEQKSVVEIYQENGVVQGKIVEIFDKEKRDLPCINCKGEDYNKPVLGLVIIKDMEKEDEFFKNGTITDPQDGKTYTCRLKLTDDPNELQVRGYIGFFYATQYWIRAKE